MICSDEITRAPFSIIVSKVDFIVETFTFQSSFTSYWKTICLTVAYYTFVLFWFPTDVSAILGKIIFTLFSKFQIISILLKFPEKMIFLLPLSICFHP